ncbi:MAG: glycosyltransferase family 4 protein [Proteobacteria bacterium]|nr:glycosyltransferase family 4 protein [Pseudomonadota bacterium]
MTRKSHTIRVLRIWGTSANISANVFDDLFRKNIGTLFRTDYMSALEFASLVSEKNKLFDLMHSYDYICPDYHLMAAVPWMMQLRNQNVLSFGVLFITHSPGLYGMEWYLIRELICPKDIIIAPSHFSARVISLLAPSLESNVEIISHPMDLKNNDHPDQKRGNTIVTLSRISEDKLIHRQIDAMDILVNTHGYHHLNMVIGGSLKDSDSDNLTSYARLLQLKIKRLNLEKNVHLAGEISAPGKNDFFRDSFVSVNLSRTLEEAFPKASVEALSYGIPVIATRWNGFVETVGTAGILLDLEYDHGRADLRPDDLARAIIAVYENPVHPKACRGQIQPYDVSILRERYRDIVSCRVSHNTGINLSPKRVPGLLDTLSFLWVFTHTEMMTSHCQWVGAYFESLKNNHSKPTQMCETFFRFFITEALKDILTGFYSFKYSLEDIRGFTSKNILKPSFKTDDFREKMRQSIYLSTHTHSKKTLLSIFSQRPDTELLKEAFLHFDQTEEGIPEPDYFLPYADYLDGQYASVCNFYSKHFSAKHPRLDQTDKLCLWARAAIKSDDTIEVTAYLTQWLQDFMTEPEALNIHMEYLKLLIHGKDTPEDLITCQFGVINDLCFDRTLAQHVEILAHAR